MRQRVVEPALGVGAPRWVTVEELDLDRARAPGRARRRPGRCASCSTSSASSPPRRWTATARCGRRCSSRAWPDGRAGVRGQDPPQHHRRPRRRAADGTAAQPHRRARPAPARAAGPGRPARSPAVGVLAEQVVGAARGGAAGGAAPGRRRAGRRCRPWAAVDQARGTRCARRAARWRRRRPARTLLAARGGDWHFEVLEVPLADLKAGARAAGGSLNDGFLAAVLGGFRRYHERLGAPDGHAAVGIPISLRTEDDPQGGNRFTGARCPAPARRARPGDADPGDPRVRALGAGRHAAPASVDDLLAPALGWLPAPVIGALSGRLTSANDVQASNVPGVAHPVYIAGSRITRMYPFGPLPGCAAMITLHLARGAVLHRGQRRHRGRDRSRRAGGRPARQPRGGDRAGLVEPTAARAQVPTPDPPACLGSPHEHSADSRTARPAGVGPVHPLSRAARGDRGGRAAEQRAGDHHPVPHPGRVRPRAVPARRRRGRPAAARLAGRRHGGHPGGVRADRRLPDLPDHAAGQPGDGRPARAAVRAPAAHGPVVLHRDPDRGHPVPAGQRRGRRAVGAVGDGQLDPGQRGHGGRRAGRDAHAVLAADAGRGGAGAAVRRCCRSGSDGSGGAIAGAHPGVAVGHDRDHRGVAVGVRGAAGQGVQPAGLRGRPLPGGERAARSSCRCARP